MNTPRAHQRFTHASWIEPNWTPDLSKGEKYGKGCAPKAEMEVVRVAKGQVWYDFASTSLVNIKGRWVMNLETFVERYGDALRPDPNQVARSHR